MDDILEGLNKEQKEAVLHYTGPLLILAGAGSGKTRVITRRIAYLIEECNVNPWSILALTFTNKAAGEMRERVDKLVGTGAEAIWVSTFHSTCVRILRRFIDTIGYKRNFTIYDTDDSKTAMKGVLKELNIDPKKHSEKEFLSVISKNKNNCISEEKYAEKNTGYNQESDMYVKVYKKYEERLKSNNALDFDDLLLKTVELFEKNKEALEYYRNRFRFILVDEYQDTNQVQFKLLKLLASHDEGGVIEHNLCVVGDDDQSIYKFRGANIYNILNFEQEYLNTKVIKLEENYRSTGNILEAANGVIHNNSERKDKALWTEKGAGAAISYTQYPDGYREAEGIAVTISKLIDSGKVRYSDIAVLYRTNAQSRVIEEKLIYSSIPYHMIGGVNFYQRREIKDILAYLRVIANPSDDVQARRIINVPARGIGNTTQERLVGFAIANGLTFFQACERASIVPGIARSSGKIEHFVAFIDHFRTEFENAESITETARELLDEMGYISDLEAEGTDEAQARLENIEEFLNKMQTYEDEHENDEILEGESRLQGFLNDVSLVADIDSVTDDEDSILLMTLHASKGLEFPVVFIAGMEDGIFPSYLSINSGDTSEIEEERRLCYVGITRAKEKLYLSSAARRMIRGSEQMNAPSRFLSEIPEHLISTKASLSGPRFMASDSIFANKGASLKGKEAGFKGKDGFGNPGFGKSIDELVKKTGMHGSGGTGRSSHMQSPGYKNPYIGKAKHVSAVKDVDHGDMNVKKGDRVNHPKFGVGQITDLTGLGEDAVVTVTFDKEGIGSRKMKLAFAKLNKISE